MERIHDDATVTVHATARMDHDSRGPRHQLSRDPRPAQPRPKPANTKKLRRKLFSFSFKLSPEHPTLLIVSRPARLLSSSSRIATVFSCTSSPSQCQFFVVCLHFFCGFVRKSCVSEPGLRSGFRL